MDVHWALELVQKSEEAQQPMFGAVRWMVSVADKSVDAVLL